MTWASYSRMSKRAVTWVQSAPVNQCHAHPINAQVSCRNQHHQRAFRTGFRGERVTIQTQNQLHRLERRSFVRIVEHVVLSNAETHGGSFGEHRRIRFTTPSGFHNLPNGTFEQTRIFHARQPTGFTQDELMKPHDGTHRGVTIPTVLKNRCVTGRAVRHLKFGKCLQGFGRSLNLRLNHPIHLRPRQRSRLFARRFDGFGAAGLGGAHAKNSSTLLRNPA